MLPIRQSLATPVNANNFRFGAKPFGCDCGAVGGCGCSQGMSGYMGRLGQTASLDQIISNAFSWLSGTVQSNLPTSAAIPPQVGSTGALFTTLQQWAPYLIGGFLLYELIKRK